jgi:hypothetical protein
MENGELKTLDDKYVPHHIYDAYLGNYTLTYCKLWARQLVIFVTHVRKRSMQYTLSAIVKIWNWQKRIITKRSCRVTLGLTGYSLTASNQQAFIAVPFVQLMYQR